MERMRQVAVAVVVAAALMVTVANPTLASGVIMGGPKPKAVAEAPSTVLEPMSGIIMQGPGPRP